MAWGTLCPRAPCRSRGGRAGPDALSAVARQLLRPRREGPREGALSGGTGLAVHVCGDPATGASGLAPRCPQLCRALLVRPAFETRLSRVRSTDSVRTVASSPARPEGHHARWSAAAPGCGQLQLSRSVSRLAGSGAPSSAPRRARARCARGSPFVHVLEQAVRCMRGRENPLFRRNSRG